MADAGVSSPQELQQKWAARVVLRNRRWCSVDEVASLALYLCSNGAASITGANLSMDGGWTAA